MTIIEKIRSEIERLIKLHDSLASNAESEMIANLEIGAAQALDDILPFLSTLESEKPMNQGEERLDFQEFAKEMSDILAVYKSPSNPEEEQIDYEWTIARHFAKWGAEHSGSSETSKEDKLRYCVEYINPCFPLLDNGDLNVRHLRVPDEHWAEMTITLILSFGGKIYALYRGNVKDGKLADWPTPMIVESEDWFTDEWLHELMDCGHNCL